MWPGVLIGVPAALQPLKIPGLRELLLTGAGSYSPYRPQAVGRAYVSISTDGTHCDPVEWLVFGEHIDDLTAAVRPEEVFA